MSRPRLAVYRHLVLPPSETFVKNQIDALREFDVTLFGIDREPSLVPDVPTFLLEEHGNRLVARLRVRAFQLLRRSPTLRRTIAASRPDLLVTHFAQDAWRIVPTASAARRSARRGVPRQRRARGRRGRRQGRPVDASARRPLGRPRRRVRAVRRVLAVPRATRSSRRGVPADKVVVHHLGVPIPPLAADAARADLLFVGRLVESKNAAAAVRAHARLLVGPARPRPHRRRRRTRARTARGAHGRAGDERARPVRRRVPARARGRADDVARRARGPEHQGRQRRVRRLRPGRSSRRRRAGCPPSSTTPAGCARPSATTGEGGALLVPTGDEDALVNALGAILDDPALAAELGARGRARAVEQFDLDTLHPAVRADAACRRSGSHAGERRRRAVGAGRRARPSDRARAWRTSSRRSPRSRPRTTPSSRSWSWGPPRAATPRRCADRYGFRWIDEAGRSLSAAINQGWADADDATSWRGSATTTCSPPVRSTRACEALVRKPRAPMVYGRCQYIDADGAEIFVARPGRFAVWFSRFGQDVIPQPGSFQRASAVRDVGGDRPVAAVRDGPRPVPQAAHVRAVRATSGRCRARSGCTRSRSR